MAKGKATAPKPPLTLPEYERIYQLIYSVLDGRANTPHACMFFAITSSMILNKHYKIPATPVAGAFLLCVDPNPFVISIAKNENGTVTSDRSGFHMWIQTETHAIDFMTPIFKESIKSSGNGMTVPRKMFQRPLSEETDLIEELTKPGDYFTIPNPELTKELIDSFTDRDGNMDLVLAADRWFEKYPKKMDDLSLMDDLGKVHKLILSAPPIKGAW